MFRPLEIEKFRFAAAFTSRRREHWLPRASATWYVFLDQPIRQVMISCWGLSKKIEINQIDAGAINSLMHDQTDLK